MAPQKKAKAVKKKAAKRKTTQYSSALSDWETETLSEGSFVHLLVATPTVPSPLAQLTAEEKRPDPHSPLTPLARAFQSTCHPDARVRSELRQARQWITEVDSRIMYSNRHGELKQLPATYEDSSKDGESMIVNINKTSHFTVVNVPCDLPIGARTRTADLRNLESGRSVDKGRVTVRCIKLRHHPTGRFDIFLFTGRHRDLVLNGHSIGPNTYAGPLSKFATIQVGEQVALCWFDKEGFDYKPGIDTRKRSFSNVEEAAEASPHGPRAKRLRSADDALDRTTSRATVQSPPPQSWKDIFYRGLEHERAQQPRGDALRLDATRGITDDVVVRAIASFWAAKGRPTAFGQEDVFKNRTRDAQRKTRQVVCGQSRKTLLMPLCFQQGREKPPEDNDESAEEDQDQDLGAQSREIGHFVLAIATRKDSKDRSRKPIEIKIYDSRPGSVEEDDIKEAARRVVKYSGWLGMSADQPPRIWLQTPHFDPDPVIVTGYPNQGGQSLHCGLYVVLRAWAHLLDIEVTSFRSLRLPTGKTLADFHKEGMEIVSLALTGRMDSRTVQAYMRYYGFSIGGKKITNEVEDHRAQPMTDSILRQEIEDQMTADIVAINGANQAYSGDYLEDKAPS
ncbi:hypothetical protein G7Y79_00073g098150 [Physcia stellaris]|nr:hypothetical protein G7Y79_00073g098150 [Physcia stellaris]